MLKKIGERVGFGGGAIIGGIADGLSIWKDFPKEVTGGLITITALVAGQWFYKSFMEKDNPESSPLLLDTNTIDRSHPKDPIFGLFKTISQNITIDIQPNSRDIIYKRSIVIESLNQYANTYFTRFAPSNCFKNIEYRGGHLLFEEIRNGGLDVILQLDDIFDIGQKQIIEIEAEATDVFWSEKESWTMHKYYDGEELTIINILFPIGNRPSIPKACIAFAQRYTEGRSLKLPIKEKIVNGRHCLSIETINNELAINEEIYISWQWQMVE